MLGLGALLLAQVDSPFLRYPDIHGDNVVFTCEGDLWVGSISSGNAMRLTRDAGVEQYARFSPDGKTILYQAQYNEVPEIYTIPTEGGTPKRLTYRFDYADPLGWAPDGDSILYRARSYPRSYGLYTMPKDGGPEGKMPIEFAAHGVYSPDGNSVAFTRFNRWDDAWFRYEGGMKNDIWVGDLQTKRFRQITKMPGTCEFPAWEGDNVCFVMEQDAEFTIYSTNSSGSTPKALYGPHNFEIRELNSGPGALVFQKGTTLGMIDLKSGKQTDLNFNLLSDRMHTRPYSVDPERHVQGGSITPTGKRALVSARGQIVTLPVGEGEARVWKAKDGVRLGLPLMSPKGDKVAYVSDESGEEQLWIADADGSNERQLTNGVNHQLVNFQWSPDGTWIGLNTSEMELHLVSTATGRMSKVADAFSDWSGVQFTFSPDSKWVCYAQFDGITGMSQLVLLEIETDKRHELGNGLTHDALPYFSKDGKYLGFISRRNFAVGWDEVLNQMNTDGVNSPAFYRLRNDTPDPLALKDPTEEKEEKKEEGDKAFRIDLDNIENRLTVLSPTGNLGQIAFSGSRVIYSGEGNISYYDLASKQSGQITAGGGFSISDDEKKLMVGNRVVDASGTNVPPTTGRLSFGSLKLQIDPVAEWQQMYWDAWRLLRDYFYVENMHGLDWPAIGRKYAAFLPNVRSRDELDVLIRWLQAELGSSHQYLQGGDEQNLKPSSPGAYLGIDVEADKSANRLRISDIMRGDGIVQSERSPLLNADPLVKEGDYLLEVNGVPMTASSNYLQPLQGRAGQIVSVMLNDKPTMEGARKVLVRPTGNERRMRILDWVENNRQYVDKATGGRVGYIYMQAMTPTDMADFIKQFYPQRNKEALVIDTRFNNGGNTQSIINRILAEKLTGFFNMRASGTSWSRQGDYFLGPMVCLQNEFNVSCGEEFPDRWRDLGLGPIIGRRTYGGEVGSSPGWPLADGGVVSVPNYGMWTPEDGWVIEGPGVSPDMDVPSDPNLFAQGKDAQLDAGIKYLLDFIRRNPTPRPQQPPDPVKVKGGGN